MTRPACHCGCGSTQTGRAGWARGHDSRALRRARQRHGGLANLLAAADRDLTARTATTPEETS